MKLASFEAIVRALNEAGVRYLVVGGVAVNAHGYQRLTHDVDLVVQLLSDNTRAAFNALESLGYRPSIPVTSKQFADAKRRKSWITDKGMQVLNLHSDEHQQTPVNLFVTEPFDFDHEHEQAMRAELEPGLSVPFVNIKTLIEMKRDVDRPRDKDDIQHLLWIEQEQSHE